MKPEKSFPASLIAVWFGNSKKISFFIVFILSILFINNSFAQISQLTIGVDGFTCSLCAKGVEEQFKALDFVKSVKTDLRKALFVLTFRSNPKIEISKIREAVYDGGFSVRDIKVVAKGSIKGDQQIGYVLVTSNTPEISLKNIKGEFSDGDKVELKGNINSEVNSISVTSIKKL